MALTKAAGLVVFRKINERIEFLMLQTSYGEHHWTPPKGHVDPGETDWLTALRETEEESGIKETDLIIYKDITHTLNYNVNGKAKMVTYWLAKLRNPKQKVTLSSEHQEARWLELADAMAVCKYQDTCQLLQHFHERVQHLLTDTTSPT